MNSRWQHFTSLWLQLNPVEGNSLSLKPIYDLKLNSEVGLYGSAVLLPLFPLRLLVSTSRFFYWFDPAVPVVRSVPSGVTPNAQALHDGSPPSVLKWMNEMLLNAAIYYLKKCQLAAHI